MRSESGISILPCKINGLNLDFIFDSGASDLTISVTEGSFMLKNGYLQRADIVNTENYLDANGNLNEGIIINIREIEVAGLKLENIKATISSNSNGLLLFGQSAIKKLGLIQIDLNSNILTVYKGNGTYDYSGYTDKELQTFEIGQNYGGGKIFYIDNSGRHGLVAATSDQTIDGITWANSNNEFIGCNNTSLGFGQLNSNKIGKKEVGISAATVCLQLNLNGFNDWYLPTKDELNELFKKDLLSARFITSSIGARVNTTKTLHGYKVSLLANK
jgi:hypothetical protein